MNTMTLTKVTAAICGSFLVLLLGKWVAEALYHVEGHGEAAYVIETESGDDAGHEEVAEVSFDDMLAEADIGKGAKVYKKCAACHKIEDGVNAVGPSLYGIVGRAVASVSSFGGYSAPMKGKGGDWSPEALDTFLIKPSDDIPGTKMSFAGLKKQGDRVNLIAYLDSLDD